MNVNRKYCQCQLSFKCKVTHKHFILQEKELKFRKLSFSSFLVEKFFKERIYMGKRKKYEFYITLWEGDTH